MDALSQPDHGGQALAHDLLLAVIPGVLVVGWSAELSLLAQGEPVTTTALLAESAARLAFVLMPALVLVPLVLRGVRRLLPAAGAPGELAVLVPTICVVVALASQVRLMSVGHELLPATLVLGDVVGALPVAALAAVVSMWGTRRLAPEPVGGEARSRETGISSSARARRPRRLAGAAVLLGVLAGSGIAPSTAATGGVSGTSGPATAASGISSCLDRSVPADLAYDVTALDVDVTINRFGDHDPKGKMYALTSRVAAVRAQEASHTVSSGLHDDAIQPLVLRANQGDCVEVTYTNRASGGPFGLHVDGLEFATDSSGDAVGANPDSAAASGQTVSYRFAVPDDPALEGGHDIHPGPGNRAAIDHGLFGALVVEPPGSTYWDASTPGQPLESGWEAIVKPAGVDVDCVPSSAVDTCGFREAVLMHHEIGNDNERLTARSGALIPLVDNLTGTYRPGSFALNYRSEPFRNRLLAFPKEKAHAYSSYTFGEPATPIMRGYLGDPTKIRLMHVGAEKFHIFHLHGGGDRWRFNPQADPTFDYAATGLHKDPDTEASPSMRLDSQSVGPGESYNLELEGGAGGVQQSAGDFLFHCHIAKHYNAGMWGLWRVYDTQQPDLVPLTDRYAPPQPVDSRGLIGRTISGTTITAANLDGWIRAQLPPQGVPRSGQDATVWDWKVAGTATRPLYLGAPADPTVFADSVKLVAGQPNLLPIDVGRVVTGRPAILFNPVNGRPAYPMFRTAVGKRPPFTGAGHTGTPWLGANVNQSATKAADPWAGRDDGLCPSGRALRTFNVVTVGKAIRRTPTVTDPDGKLFVLAKDKTAVLGDPNRSDPLALRANQGDCIAITLTNEIPDAAAFDKFSKASMHIHHVQFDVQGSDGVSAGFAYEHSVRPYKVGDATLVAAARAGDTVLRLTDVTALVGKDANGRPTQPFVAVGEGLESIDIHQVVSVDPVAKTVTLGSRLDSDHAVGEYAGTEFIQYRWYPDALLDNVFWHDHVDGIHGWGHGLVGQLIVEPEGSTYHDPVTGQVVDSGTLVDIHTSKALAPGLVSGSFRELALWTINDNDADGFSTLNLKANPLAGRLDKAHQFSSWTYGDPVTPLPRAYPSDPVVIRTISVSPTVDTLHLQGGRTLLEPRYTHAGPDGPTPEGTLIDAIHYGVSEKFSLVFNGESPGMRMRPGDYLYANGNELRTQQGAWGVVRVLPGRVDDLRPLPGVTTPSTPYAMPVTTGGAPPPTASPGNPCPSGAPARHFAVSAVDKNGAFAGARTAWVPSADVAAVKRGTKAPVPLVLHVVAGDCVTVDVTNLLTVPVGFSVAKLDREAGSGGVDIGFAPEQGIAPAATRTYVYFAPSDRVGTAVIADLAGSTTLKQGLYGAVVVAPASLVPGESTSFSDPVTGASTDIGAQVLVHVPGSATPDYRDFTVALADDDVTIGQDFMPYPTGARAGRSLISYQAAPVGDGPAAFRNPGSVPFLTAFTGDPEVVHVLLAPGSENTHVFGLGGLSWPRDPFLERSNVVAAQGISPWETYDAHVLGGAGGTGGFVGDLFYGDLRRPFTAVGLWGLQRVLSPSLATCPIRRVDGSTC